MDTGLGDCHVLVILHERVLYIDNTAGFQHHYTLPGSFGKTGLTGDVSQLLPVTG